MLAVQQPHMAKTLRFGHKAKTLGMTKTLGGGCNNKKRRREDVTVHIEESKRQKFMPKLPVKVKTITDDVTESVLLAIKRAKQLPLEKKRKAARVSLQAMEKEVDIDDNFETFKQLRMLCGGYEVVMGSFNFKQFGMDLVLKKEEEEEEEEHGCSVSSSLSKSSLRMAITRAQQVLLKKKREAAKVSLQAMEKEVDIDDNFKTFKQLRRLCGGHEVVMGSFDFKQFGMDLVLKKEEVEEEEHDCSGLYHLSAIKTPPSPSKPSLSMAITTTDQQLLLKKKREAARAALLAMEKEVDIDDNFETFKQLRMLCGGREVLMRSFKKKDEEEEEEED